MAAVRFGLIGMGRHGMRYAQHLLLSAVFAENSPWSPRSFSLQLVHQWTMCGQQNIPSLTLECPCISYWTLAFLWCLTLVDIESA